MINEYYANIKGFEDLYQVSNYGTVKSITHRVNKDGCQLVKGKILSPFVDRKNGYLCVNLSRGGKYKIYRVHRLVAETFIPNPDHLPQVNHKDCNKMNNHIDNLEWCTQQENIRHAVRNGLYKRK